MRDLSEDSSGRRRTIRLWLLLAGLLLVPLAVAPQDLPGWSPCLFRAATGLPCPGCGLTHSLLAAGRGDWAAASGYHPLGGPVWLGATGFWVACGARLVRGRPAPSLRAAHAAAAACLLLAVWFFGLISRGR